MKKIQGCGYESERTITIRPESKGNLLCLEYGGAVTKEDNEECIMRPARDIIKKYGGLRCLSIFTPDFKGWTPEAAENNMKFGLECAQFCERLAYVNPSKRKMLQMKLSEPLLKCPIRYFNESDIDEALAWIKQND